VTADSAERLAELRHHLEEAYRLAATIPAGHDMQANLADLISDTDFLIAIRTVETRP
jgi:hypothetical protein